MSNIIVPNPDALQQDKRRLGELVYQARKAAGISQAKLGAYLGASEDTIASLEHGTFSSYDLAYAVAQYFHFSFNDLFPHRTKTHEELLQDALDMLKKEMTDKDAEIIALKRTVEQFNGSQS